MSLKRKKMRTFSIFLSFLKFSFRIKIINAANDGLLKKFMEKLHMNPKHVKYLNKNTLQIKQKNSL